MSNSTIALKIKTVGNLFGSGWKPLSQRQKEMTEMGRKLKVTKHKTTEIIPILKVFRCILGFICLWLFGLLVQTCANEPWVNWQTKRNPKTKWLDHWLTQAHWIEFHAHNSQQQIAKSLKSQIYRVLKMRALHGLLSCDEHNTSPATHLNIPIKTKWCGRRTKYKGQ